MKQQLITYCLALFTTFSTLIGFSQSPQIVDTTLINSNCSVGLLNGECDGKGSITIMIGDIGASNYRYRVAFGPTIPADIVTSDTSATFTNLCKGFYFIFVINNENGQSDQIAITLDGSEVFNTNPTTTNVKCSGEDNGEIDLNITGGTPPYDVLWSHGPTSENISDLSPNQYFVDITDQVGCNTKDTFAITDGDTLTADFNFTDACVNTPIDFTDNSTTSNGTLNYEWSFANGTPSTANTVGPHSVSFNTDGNNDIKLKIDNGNCTDSITKTANVFPPPTITLTNDDNICFGESIQLLATGGTTYSWTGANLSATNIANPIASPTVTTTYEVTVTNANGCIAKKSVTITVDPLPSINASNDTSVCVNETISLSASGGNSYLWSPRTGINGSNTSASISTTVTNTITYKVVVSTINNCKDSTNVTITAKDLPVVSSTEDLEICKNQTTQLSVTGASTYVWTPNTNINNTTSSSPMVTPTTTTRYTVVGTAVNGCKNSDSTLVTVNSNPTITTSNDTTICENSSVTLTASGGNTYLWKPVNKTTPNITETPLVTTIYEAVITDINGCKDSSNITVSVNPSPVLTTSNDTTICEKDTVFLSASGATNYLWSPSVSNNSINNPFATPITNTTYKVVGSNGFNCKDSSTVNVTVNTLPTVSLPKDSTICFQSSLDITATGALTYIWSPSTDLSANTGQTVTSTPNNTITYTVTGKDLNQCTDTADITITVAPDITIDMMNDTVVCKKTSINLSANVNNASTFVWSPSTSSPNQLNTTAQPNTTTTYILTASNLQGCSKQDSVTVTVDESPNVTISNDTTVCSKTPLQLTAAGGNSYTWTSTEVITDSNNDTITVNPKNTTTYNLKVTTPAGCNVDTSVTVTTIPLPIPSNINDTSICLNSPLNYNLNNGANTISWVSENNGVISTTNTLDYTPTASDSIFVIFQNAQQCTATDTIAVTVLSLPKVTTTPADTTICLNDTLNFTASGANSYLWITNTGDITDDKNSTTKIIAKSTKTYQVIGTDNNGCIDTADVTVTVNPIPTLTVTKDTSICFNDTVTLTAAGADNYTWTPTSSLTSTNTASTKAFPSTTTQYIVKGEFNSGCFNFDTVNITVTPKVSVTAMADTAICKGESIALTANTTNATSTSWTPTTGITDPNTTNTTVNPLVTTSYIITAQNANNCSAQDTVNITVDESPNVTISNDTTVCSKTPLQLIAAGGNSYTWTSTEVITDSNNDTITVNPTNTTTYNLKVTTHAGCNVDTSVTITTIPLPTPSNINDTSICLNSPLNYSLNNGANTISWVSKNNGVISTTNALDYTPTASDSIFVVFQNAQQCTATDTIAVTVLSLPKVTTTPADTTICLNDTLNFTASGANTYLWITNTGDITDNKNSTTKIIAKSTKTYQVIGTDNNGCIDTADVRVTVNPIPTLTVSKDTSICFNDTVTLTASGADNYTWTPTSSLTNTNTASTKAFPSTTTQYIVKGEFNSGCFNFDTVNITVTPKVSVTAMADTAICKGESIALTANTTNATSTSWTPTTGITDPNTTNTTVSPLVTTSYIITAQNANNCSAQDTVNITVDESPNVTISNDTTVCVGTNLTLIASGGKNYLWASSEPITNPTNDSINVTPNSTTTYNLKVTTPTGCNVDTNVTVSTSPLPNKPSINDTSICLNEVFTKTYNTSDDINWISNNGNTLSSTNTLNYTPTKTDTIIVQLTNASKCSITDTFIISLQSIPTIDITANNPTTICKGDELILTASGATDYVWTPELGITSKNLNNFNINVKPTVKTTYEVTGTSNNCSSTKSITIDVKDIPTINVSSDTNICENSTITLQASGASSYTWSPIVDGMTSPNASSTQVTPTKDRVFTVTGTATNGCSATNQISVTTSETPTGTVTGQKDTICFDEKITLTASLDPQHIGNSNGTYSFDNITFNANNTLDITGNPSGNQNIMVLFKNQFGCISKPINIDILTLTPIKYEVDTINIPSCTDPSPSGEFKLKNIIGGNGNYTINFNSFVTQDTSHIFKNISPGTYPLNVTDDKGCNNPTILDYTSNLDFDTTLVEPTCNKFTNGQIKLSNIKGGIAPYQFSLNDKNNYQNDSTFSALAANTYTVFIKDNANCEIPLSFTLKEPTAIKSTTLSLSHEKCVGDNEGKLSFTIAGGTPNYSTSINNTTISGDTVSLDKLAPSTYIFTVTDKNNCIYEDSLVITPADTLKTYVSQQFSLTDCKSADASGVIDSTRGGSGFYQYSADNGVTFKDENNIEATDLKGLSAGKYVITTKDIVKGCTINTTLTIGTTINLDTLKHNATPPTCKLYDGKIELLNHKALGLPNLKFELIDSASRNTLFSKRNAHTFTGNLTSQLVTGNYIVVIHDENTCTYDYPVTIDEANVVIVTDSITLTSCGQEDGSIKLNIAGGVLPYTITFTAPTNKDSISNTTILYDSLGAGQYIYKVTDSSSCEVIDTIQLEDDKVDIITKVDSLKCYNDRTGAIRIVELNNADTSKYKYSFTFNNQTETTDSNFINLNGGWYNLQVYQRDKTTNDLLCMYNDQNKYYNITYAGIFHDSISIDKIYLPSPDSIFSYTKTTPSDADETNGEVIIDSIYGKLAPHYVAINDTNNFTRFVTGSAHTFKSLGQGQHTLFTKDSTGCIDTLVLTVGVRFFMPNVFTPNFDGKNDYLKVFDYDSPIYLKVYDQWGTIIYEMEDYDNSWDGGNTPDGTYFYEIITDDRKLNGWLQIIR